jgi:uncharacterized protein (DUF302 family)
MTPALHSTRTVSVEHVTIRSAKPFHEVQAKLATLAPQIDDGIFTLLRYGESTRALQELEACPPLSIFARRDHGALLAIAGLKRRSIQYDIGNPLTASKMSRHQLSAGLYAPIRVLLREDEVDGVGFEYDRPASMFGQFGSEEVDAVAQQLDHDLRALLEAAAT